MHTGKSLSYSLDNDVVQKELSQTFDKHCSDSSRERGLPFIFSTKLRPEGPKKKIFEILPHLCVWMTGPSYVKVWIQIWMAFHSTEVTLSFRRRGLLLKNYLLLAAYHGPLLYSDLGHLIIEAQKDGLIFSTCFWFIWWQRVSQSYRRGRTETSLHKANVISVWLFGT